MKFKNYWKTLLIALIILTGSIMSGNKLNKIPLFEVKNSDKLIHFTMYFGLMLSMLSSYYKSIGNIKNTNKVVIFFIAVLYGLILEGIQYFFTTDRSAEFADMIANTLGCFIGLLYYPLLLRFNLYKIL